MKKRPGASRGAGNVRRASQKIRARTSQRTGRALRPYGPRFAGTTVGLSIRPTEAVGFNFDIHFNRDPDIDLRLPDDRPFPPYQTNIGATGFSMSWVWAF